MLGKIENHADTDLINLHRLIISFLCLAFILAFKKLRSAICLKMISILVYDIHKNKINIKNVNICIHVI